MALGMSATVGLGGDLWSWVHVVVPRLLQAVAVGLVVYFSGRAANKILKVGGA